MFYFFHHYELPVIIQQAQFFQLPHGRIQNNNNVNSNNNNNLVNNNNTNNGGGGGNRSRFWMNFIRAGRPSTIMRMNVNAIFAQIQQRQNQEIRRQQQSQPQTQQSDYQVNREIVPPVDSPPTSRAQDLDSSNDRVQIDEVEVITQTTTMTSSPPPPDLILEKKEEIREVEETNNSSNSSQSAETQSLVTSSKATDEREGANSDNS